MTRDRAGRRRPSRGLGLGVAVLAVLAVLAALSGCASSPVPAAPGGSDSAGPDRVVRVAAAADLKFALDDIIDLVEKTNPGIRVDATYGSSGTFLTQISNGAPFDVFLSADVSYPQQLVEAGLAEKADLFPYAVGRLVLWVPEGSALDPADGLGILASPGVTAVAIANPEHAPYGKAAVAALQEAGQYDAVSPKLVLGENVAQAAEFVSSGNADAGIVALSLVLSDPLKGVGRWVELPLASYPRLDQGGVVLSAAQDPAAARTVRDTMLGPAGTAILTAYGFTLPGN
ncbi:molybdate ABC transporter substrate-binding protein [Cryobacterium sp. TMT1-21]|uniref:Molybdate ABC transporter substrate-binding protein n=2 Tax=Microbacteriaceae TaxID=85023 RepID=A0AAQ2C835_9MICO|nr:molybdate ABC transporter substrate-binding protein [Cryobacterium sp. TMT2-10]TFC51338.1 molybdate ABC transporter substrate-binding protein [Cryobacterium shii]TFC83753.1 molybdate ABC transporter substrate-binding protein [Cryobacterium sp. TmT2-59]TFD15367.1 molybdate ABC transporter substrate-binding protein [Cryobacterium sp. TMT1-21]TFD20583.1 molybdate ABC transporter substrate-binding protein [Cryobacterium sp. TMT4-10]TFD20762.1 molybdate ABC transporter substrate-binding protein 